MFSLKTKGIFKLDFTFSLITLKPLLEMNILNFWATLELNNRVAEQEQGHKIKAEIKSFSLLQWTAFTDVLQSFSKGTYPWGLRHPLGFWCQEKQLVSAVLGQCCFAWHGAECFADWLKLETDLAYYIIHFLFAIAFHRPVFYFYFFFCFWLWGVRGEGSNHMAFCRCSICISINLEPPGDTWAQAQHALCFNLWESIPLLNKLIHMYSLFQTAH